MGSPNTRNYKAAMVKVETNLRQLNSIKIARCLKPKNFGDMLDYIARIFSQMHQVLGMNKQAFCQWRMKKKRLTVVFSMENLVSHHWSLSQLQNCSSSISKVITKIETTNRSWWKYLRKRGVLLFYINNELKQLKADVANHVQMIRNNIMYLHNIRFMFRTVFKWLGTI